MKNFDEFADKFIDDPGPFTKSNEQYLMAKLNQYLPEEVSADLIQFLKNYSMLMLDEYHHWLNA
jgi:hypothetical protein